MGLSLTPTYGTKVALMESHPDQESQNNVVSPFSDVETSLPANNKKSGNLMGWIIGGVIAAIVLAVGGFFLVKHLRDPLRTLEKLPVAKYYESFRSLAGARFKADLQVEADLGWKEGVGRLMVFTTPDEPRPIVVMIPASFSHIHFTKGQTYRAELEVKEGGMIYANSCKKI